MPVIVVSVLGLGMSIATVLSSSRYLSAYLPSTTLPKRLICLIWGAVSSISSPFS